MSDYIKQNVDYQKNNVYCVRYLIDTVVSHQVAGLDVKLDYESYGILKPDKTIFIGLNENVRQERIEKRGKSILDKVLDDDKKRKSFLETFKKLLSENDTIYFDNSLCDVDSNVHQLYERIKKEEYL